jgi:D-3-phosphoglycerate dehydrogenase
MGCELQGKTLGVVGFGRIGSRVAEMCRDALHMPVLVYDPYLDPDDIVEWGATPVDDLLTLARQVDVLTVHTPLTAETRHIIDAEVLAALKPTAILINAARGPVVDEAALEAALAAGQLAGVGLDVFDPEPPLPDNPLFQYDRVVFTPHTGSYTDEGRRRMGRMAVEEILHVLRGERPDYLANPEVWPKRRRLD